MYTREESKKLRLDFWEQFGRRCEGHPLLRHKQKKWTLHRTKIKGLALRFDVGRENAAVMIELNHKNENKRLATFEILERYKPILEEGFPDGLVWEFYHQREDSGQEVCRIYHAIPSVDLHRREHWPEIFNFFIENMTRLEENFLQIRDLVKDELRRIDL